MERLGTDGVRNLLDAMRGTQWHRLETALSNGNAMAPRPMTDTEIEETFLPVVSQ